MGWGRDEMSGYYYWGGKFDLQEFLREQGYEVHTLSVGPISSNHDRAVEVFYQIKGGQVDYGATHSGKYDLIQKPEGKYYNGLYPQWNSENPIHIIAHSQGGQTARMLEYLLNNIIPTEENELFKNQYLEWIKSITTISTPHNGTTLVPIIQGMFPFINSMVVWMGVISQKNAIENYFNFDLDQWGLNKTENENIFGYLGRVKKTKISGSQNFSSWDLSPTGADEFNQIYHTDSTVYYFSFATTAKSLNSDNTDKVRMKYKLQTILIEKTDDYPEEWRENDGIVNTISMGGPTGSKIEIFSGIPKPGVWQVMDKIYLDHHEVVGHLNREKSYENIKILFTDHCELLYSIN